MQCCSSRASVVWVTQLSRTHGQINKTFSKWASTKLQEHSLVPPLDLYLSPFTFLFFLTLIPFEGVVVHADVVPADSHLDCRSVKKAVTTAEYVQSLTQLPCNDNNPSLFSLRRADTQIRLFVVVVKWYPWAPSWVSHCVCVCGLAGFFFIVVSSFLPTATQWAGRASTCTNIVEIKTNPTDLWGRRVSSSSALCCSLTAASPRGVPVFGGRLFSFHHRDFRRKNSHISPCVSVFICLFPGKVSVGCLCSISELLQYE